MSSGVVQSLHKQLKSVQAAIARIEENGQKGSTNDLSYEDPNLQVLYQREKDLKRQIARKSGRRPFAKSIRVGG